MRLERYGGGEAVGETQNRPFQLSFNTSLKVDFQGARVTSDGGLILVRELDERLGLSVLIERWGKRVFSRRRFARREISHFRNYLGTLRNKVG
jgi:hypothetical protein